MTVATGEGEDGKPEPQTLSHGVSGPCSCMSLAHTPLSRVFSQQWVTSRQMRFEGGFQGRCNKLVDGCYSFWQAGLLPLLHRALHAQGESTLPLGLEEEPPGLSLTQRCGLELKGNSDCLGF